MYTALPRVLVVGTLRVVVLVEVGCVEKLVVHLVVARVDVLFFVVVVTGVVGSVTQFTCHYILLYNLNYKL